MTDEALRDGGRDELIEKTQLKITTADQKKEKKKALGHFKCSSRDISIYPPVYPCGGTPSSVHTTEARGQRKPEIKRLLETSTED